MCPELSILAVLYQMTPMRHNTDPHNTVLHHFINTVNEVTFTQRAATVDASLRLMPPAGQRNSIKPVIY